jgi:hypothetical protein
MSETTPKCEALPNMHRLHPQTVVCPNSSKGLVIDRYQADLTGRIATNLGANDGGARLAPGLAVGTRLCLRVAAL